MKEFGSNLLFDKMTALRTIFPNMAFVYAQMVPSWAYQLLLQLLIQQFDINCLYNVDTLNKYMKEFGLKK